jgi:predicted TIM-barrel fold metal-dependent hydrolase
MDEAIRDAHTHFFSRTFFATLAGMAPGGRPTDELLADLAARAGLALPPADDMALAESWLEQMGEAGIASMVTFASVPEEAAVVAEVARLSAGQLTGYTVVNPLAPTAPAFLDRALGELGLRGVVLFPALHHYHLGDEVVRPMLEKVRAARAVCVVHCGVLHVPLRDLLGLPRTYDARFASPLSVVRAACEFPEVPFVIPHFGAGMLQETLLAGAWCANIHVDSSSSNAWMRAMFPRVTGLAEVFERALAVFGPSRILYGTDSSTFPRGYRRDLLDTQLAALDSLGLGHEDRAAILGGNLARILGEAQPRTA